MKHVWDFRLDYSKPDIVEHLGHLLCGKYAHSVPQSGDSVFPFTALNCRYRGVSRRTVVDLDLCPGCMVALGSHDDLPASYWSGPGNIEQVAIEGPCIIKAKPWGRSGKARGGRPYQSPLLHSPTWEDLLLVADDIIVCTRDLHHVFLESVYPTKESPLVILARVEEENADVPRWSLGLGS